MRAKEAVQVVQCVVRKAILPIDDIKLAICLVDNAIRGKGITSKYCVVVTLNVRNDFSSSNGNLMQNSLTTIGVATYLTVIVEKFVMLPIIILADEISNLSLLYCR